MFVMIAGCNAGLFPMELKAFEKKENALAAMKKSQETMTAVYYGMFGPSHVTSFCDGDQARLDIPDVDVHWAWKVEELKPEDTITIRFSERTVE